MSILGSVERVVKMYMRIIVFKLFNKITSIIYVAPIVYIIKSVNILVVDNLIEN